MRKIIEQQMLVGEFMVVDVSAGLSLAVRLVPCPRYHGGFNEGLLFDATTLEPSRPSFCMVPRTDPGLPLMLTRESCLTWSSLKSHFVHL